MAKQQQCLWKQERLVLVWTSISSEDPEEEILNTWSVWLPGPIKPKLTHNEVLLD